ncbi:unnamed protein product [Lactuca virosa]|uniref:Uncharacterized protein n=1 Tax=Lactuca virosa TaxID=75947 RepID=A0AAU9NTV8_9ASTR|nr:unnamed protein product [Lactuca virosa]
MLPSDRTIAQPFTVCVIPSSLPPPISIFLIVSVCVVNYRFRNKYGDQAWLDFIEMFSPPLVNRFMISYKFLFMLFSVKPDSTL